MVIKIALGVFIWIILAWAFINRKDELLGDEKSRAYVKDFMKWGCLYFLFVITIIWLIGGIGLFLFGEYYAENEFIKNLWLYIGIASFITILILWIFNEVFESKEDKERKNLEKKNKN